MDKQSCVYIMTNRRNGTLSIGITSQLIKRVRRHKTAAVSGLNQAHHATLLVYYELSDSLYAAILRERQLKKWRRQALIGLIESINPQWTDLYDHLLASASTDEQAPEA